MKSIGYFFFIICTVVIGFSSCTKEANSVFSTSKTFPQQNWPLDDHLTMEFEIKDTSDLFIFSADIEVEKDYPHENLYANIIIDHPDGTQTSRVWSFQLIDKGGYWLGRCNKKSCRINSVIEPQLYFSQQGDYNIKLAPFMRMDSIPNVISVGLRLEKFN